MQFDTLPPFFSYHYYTLGLSGKEICALQKVCAYKLWFIALPIGITPLP